MKLGYQKGINKSKLILRTFTFNFNMQTVAIFNVQLCSIFAKNASSKAFAVTSRLSSNEVWIY